MRNEERSILKIWSFRSMRYPAPGKMSGRIPGFPGERFMEDLNDALFIYRKGPGENIPPIGVTQLL